MIELARPAAHESALDVACGWGFVTLAVAPLVRSAIGIDLTPEMVELAKKLAAGSSISNADFEVGDAEDLPFKAGTFDLVLCRAAFDHLGDPERALREMKRVLAPGGRIVLYEFVAPATPDKASFYNRIESARDPSHLRSFTVEEYRRFIRECGLEESGRVITLLKREFESWMSYADSSNETRQEVRSLLLDSIKGDRAGLAPRLQGGVLSFTHTCVAWLLVPGKEHVARGRR
jgi:ubiquinone/menaquinone biosynthesis C-methylase UbiE